MLQPTDEEIGSAFASAVKSNRGLEEACDELERELLVRCRCFPRWVNEGRMSRSDAKDRLARLGTALCLLRQSDATVSSGG
jgi:hypothetical protein